MTEKIMGINDIPLYLSNTLNVNKVKVQESNRIITIVPIEDNKKNNKNNCPFLGLAADSNLTVDKYLNWKRKERDNENEKELHT